jgi:hypothetical protein
MIPSPQNRQGGRSTLLFASVVPCLSLLSQCHLVWYPAVDDWRAPDDPLPHEAGGEGPRRRLLPSLLLPSKRVVGEGPRLLAFASFPPPARIASLSLGLVIFVPCKVAMPSARSGNLSPNLGGVFTRRRSQYASTGKSVSSILTPCQNLRLVRYCRCSTIPDSGNCRVGHW